MALRENIKKFIIVACNLKGEHANLYLSALSDNEESYLSVFWSFALGCNDTLLSIMDELGYCKHDQKLIKMIRAILKWRGRNYHTKTDEGGHIAAFFRRNGQERGKWSYYCKSRIKI